MEDLKNRQLCCIVVPVYGELSADDRRCLCQYKRVFQGRDILCIVPNSISANIAKNLIEGYDFKIVGFDDGFFRNPVTYSRLLTMAGFYEYFKGYEYMLIAQLDAWVFSDRLDFWCGKGYDYVGAPWCHMCNHVCRPDADTSQRLVGNGGLSLRRIGVFADKLAKLGGKLPDFIPEDIKLVQYLELNIPRCDEALLFSVENRAADHVLKNGVKSMGFHNVKKLFPVEFDKIFKSLET